MSESSAVSATRRAGRDRPLEVSHVAANLPFVVRTVLGMAALAIGVNLVGVIINSLIVLAMDTSATDHQVRVLLVTTTIVVVASIAIGISCAIILQRRTLRWLLRGERPSFEDSRRALRFPRDMAFLTVTLWSAGAIAVGVAAAVADEDAETVRGICGGIVLAGLSTAGLTYLLIGRANAGVARLALAACPPKHAPVFGVRWRLLMIWALTSGTPLLGLVLVLMGPRQKAHIIGTSIVVAVLAILLGALSTALAARTIGDPLRGLVDALHSVEQGDLDIALQVEDAGEIGLVQNGFNDMVVGLRERDRVTDLFGRHVGSAVASEALRSGVTLAGEVRDVVAVFVDIIGSTQRSRETDPQTFVAMLNRFYEIVVDEVEGGGGLVNKFEGDAALCVFGAPVELIDAPSAGLRAARQMRDRVVATGEVRVGVGVAVGPVVAGQVGTTSRLEFTVIGDAVNEAARLTELSKESPSNLLASASVVERAGETEKARWKRAGEVVLRGHDVPTQIWTA